jgi:hypothetical protein
MQVYYFGKIKQKKEKHLRKLRNYACTVEEGQEEDEGGGMAGIKKKKKKKNEKTKVVIGSRLAGIETGATRRSWINVIEADVTHQREIIVVAMTLPWIIGSDY